jgi:glutamate racemase
MTTARSTRTAANAAPCIGVFDSGIGGLSVLGPLRALLPGARFVYACDAQHAPYGERDDAFIVERLRRFATLLREAGAQLLVIACNTATAAAIDALRQAHADWPIVGIEPAVKPAAALTRTGHVGVMATGSTLRSARLRRLLEQHAGGVTLHLQPCPGLADAIERGEAGALHETVQLHCAPLRAAGCDVVVLGCTHYPLAAASIAQALGPDVVLLDPAEAVARRVASLLPPQPALAFATPTLPIGLWTSGDLQRLTRVAQRLIDSPFEPRALRL